MTNSIHDSLTPPERVAHFLQECLHQAYEYQKHGADPDTCLYDANKKDVEAIDELLKDWDRYKEKYAALQTRCYVAEEKLKHPASMWRNKLVAIILASVEGIQPYGNGIKVFLTSGNYVVIDYYDDAVSFASALDAYRVWRDSNG